MNKTKITLIKGDGIGPEITEAVLKILSAAKVDLEYEEAIVGEKIYHQNSSSGIDEAAWKIIKRNPVMLKAPITTPMGGGYKSLNVTMRKELGLYVNLRPSVSYFPVVQNSPKIMDLIIIRENEEDLYAGIEYRQTGSCFTSLKMLTKEGSIKICEFAFEYARAMGRKKVTCMIKDNIMKISDGMFYQAFLEVAKHYPEIEHERYIIDIGAARLACRPEAFDVVVTENLYGDIISDITSEVAGSVGLAGSANIGKNYAMFEAIHGSAPAMAGQNSANPTAFLNGAILMLEYLKMFDKAILIKNALLKTLEDGIHTKDLYQEGISKQKIGTNEFADEVIKRLGQKPCILKSADDNTGNCQASHANEKNLTEFCPQRYDNFLSKNSACNLKTLRGVDFFIDYNTQYSEQLAQQIQQAMEKANLHNQFSLSSIMSRGLKVWPHAQNTQPNKTEFCDNWMCRFMLNLCQTHSTNHNQQVAQLLDALGKDGLDIIKMEKLYVFGTVDGFSAGQGE